MHTDLHQKRLQRVAIFIVGRQACQRLRQQKVFASVASAIPDDRAGHDLATAHAFAAASDKRALARTRSINWPTRK